MELTELFGSEALTYDQFAQRCAEHKAKFADLSGGAYVGKEKVRAHLPQSATG